MMRRRGLWRWWRVAGILLLIEGVWRREKGGLYLFFCRWSTLGFRGLKRLSTLSFLNLSYLPTN